MIDGRFTKEERACIIPLDAVDEVRTGSPVCSERFREGCMRLCHEGERPGGIFAQAGLPASLIGCKRIERAACRWKEAEMEGALTKTDAPQVRHRDKVESIRREKREAVERQRAIGAREEAEMEDGLARQKERVPEGAGEGLKSSWHAGEEGPACTPGGREAGKVRADLPAQGGGPVL